MCGRSEWFCFVRCISLTIHGELNHIIAASRHMFSPMDWLNWVNLGGGYYKVVSEHGSPLGLDNRCVLVMHVSVYMFYEYIGMVIIVMHETMVCGWYGRALMTR